MDNPTFFRIHDLLNRGRDKVLGIKGTEYPTGDGDRLSNFKEVGSLLGIPADVVAMVYFLKHVLSVCTFVREGRTDQANREPLEGRVHDIQNYGDLLFAILYEQGRVTLSDDDIILLASSAEEAAG